MGTIADPLDLATVARTVAPSLHAASLSRKPVVSKTGLQVRVLSPLFL